MNYSKPFLTQVIFQANFQIDALATTIDPGLAALCNERTGAAMTEGKNSNVTFTGTNITTTFSSNWTFKGETLQIVVQKDFLQVINLRYSKYEDYHPVIIEICEKIKAIYKPVITRIALRYINNIKFSEGSTFDFSGLVNPALIAPTLEYQTFGLTRSLGIMNIFDRLENITTNFTFGFVNPEFPNLIAKRDFVLDYDCFLHMNVPLEMVSIQPILLKLRNKVNTLFEKSIEDGLRTKMIVI